MRRLTTTFTDYRVHTSLDMLANLVAGMSPETTLSRKLGLFLSFKLTNNERILALYPPLLIPSSSATAFSTATALCAIKSLAIRWQGQTTGVTKLMMDVRAPESSARAS